MMRHDVRTIAANTTVAAFRDVFPLGSPAFVIAIDEHGRYVGMVAVADAHAAEISSEQSIKSLLRYADAVLEPGMSIKEAVLTFDRAEAEALAVVNSYAERRVIGLLTEAYALRRYSAELERRRQEMIGDV
jgi:CIC family chloride channel protein